MRWKSCVCAAVLLTVAVSFAQDKLDEYVAQFNGADVELYTNAIPNADAAAFLRRNVPKLECPDVAIERAYYFRWWTYRKHLKRTPNGWVVTEFLPPVPWAGAENTIACPFGHHVAEGRWLKDASIMEDYMAFMMKHGTMTGDRSYVAWPAFCYLERRKVVGADGDLETLLPLFVKRYAAWEKGWDFRGYPMRFDPKDGLFHCADNREGMEYSSSGHGARVIVNAAMAAEARAIARLSEELGDVEQAHRFATKAATLGKNLREKLWRRDDDFFTTQKDDGTSAAAREIQGYAPWYFNRSIGREFAPCWRALTDPMHFAGKFGLTTVDRVDASYKIAYEGHPCQWNGPSWPYVTSMTLTALANAIRSEESDRLVAKDFVRLLHQYAASHRRILPDGRTVDWIDENLDPETGVWISREMLLKRGERPVERGKDYNHSTFCDLVISGLAGFEARDDGSIAVAPLFPSSWSRFRLTDIPWRGRSVGIVWEEGRLRLEIDGRVVASRQGVGVLAYKPELDVRQVFRKERFDRGDTNVRPQQPIDRAAWIWMPGCDKWGKAVFTETRPDDLERERAVFLRFGKTFESIPGVPLELDVSADERFVLFLDGREISRGPHRGLENHWHYQTYRIEGLSDGPHRLEAVVWQLGAHAPLAQISVRGGFILKASGGYDRQLTTGRAVWQVAELHNVRMTDKGKSESFGVGSQCEVRGTDCLHEMPPDSAYREAVVVRKPIETFAGLIVQGWSLFPTILHDMMMEAKTPGAVKRGDDVLVPGTRIEAGRRVRAYWDLGNYYCAYPNLEVSGGRGAKIRWGWTECLRDEKGRKGDRAAFEGVDFTVGMVDTFLPDGRSGAVFASPWWRAGRWCLIDIETADEPLTIDRISLTETRAPFSLRAQFECDDPFFSKVRPLCERSIQMCMHEMFFDCPYYEQQMYPGDGRLHQLVAGLFDPEDRIVRHAMNLYDADRREDGLIPMNCPTRGTQVALGFSTCQLFMFRDYMMNHTNKAWLKARVPGMNHTLMGLSRFENADGLLAGTPGWNFVDWARTWKEPGVASGVPPDGDSKRPNAEINLQYLYALRGAADVMAAVDEPLMAVHWRAKADRLSAKIKELFWVPERSLFASRLRKDSFSEHAQSLALLCDVVTGDDAGRCFKALATEKDLHRGTIYYTHYLFETFFKFHRSDLFFAKLGFWQDCLDLHLSTILEEPKIDSRSDCHGWGAHPLWHLQTGVAGVRSAAPFFSRVRIEPQPAHLKAIRSATPTPHGFVRQDLRFEGGRVSGTVELPTGLPGEFVWQGMVRPLKCGVNMIELPDAESKLAAVRKEFIARPVSGHVHASTVLPMDDNGFMAAWFEGSKEGDPDVAIWGAVRRDGKWSEKRVLAKVNADAPHWNPVLRRAADGRISLYFKVGRNCSDWRTYVIDSRDEGGSWSAPRELVIGDVSGGRGPVRNKCLRLASGRWLAPASREIGNWRAFIDRSDDDGQTWTASDPVRMPDAKSKDGVIQPTLWIAADGRIRAYLRSNTGFVWETESTDDGVTWSVARRTSVPNNNSGIDLVKASDGCLYLVLNTASGNWASRSVLEIWRSLDDGATWTPWHVLEKENAGEFSYPCIVESEPGVLTVTYTWKRRQIAFVRISLR